MARTKLTEEKIAELNSILDFEIESYQDELRGVNDTKYILKTSHPDEFSHAILTIYEHGGTGGREYEEIIKSTKYGKHLYQNLSNVSDRNGKPVNVVVPKPYLFTADENPYYEIEFEGVKKIISIHELIYDKNGELKNIHDYSESKITPELCEEVGAGLAAVQLAGANFQEKIDNKYPIESFEKVLETIKEKAKKENIEKIDPFGKKPLEVLEWVDQKVKEISSHYEEIKEQLEFGICHLDCHPVNLIRGEEKIYFLDYGTVGFDSYIYDMTMGLDTFVCKDNSPIDNLVKAFLKGYISVRALEEVEAQNILFFIKAGLVKWTMYRVLKCFDNHESSNVFIPRDNMERYDNWERYDFAWI